MYIQGEGSQRVGQYYGIGLQDFTPKEGYYDAIWCQWVLSHLTNGKPTTYFCENSIGHCYIFFVVSLTFFFHFLPPSR